MAQQAPPRATIEEELQRVLAWPGLARSPQLAKFLNYIVNAKLSGDEAGIKAYSIAVDVFGRPATFDPQSDPIVRVQARRLRALLDEYYVADGAGSAVRFYLPVGRYVPEFAVLEAAPSEDGTVEAEPPASESASPVPENQPVPPVRRRVPVWVGEAAVVASLIVIAVVVIVLIGNVLQPRTPRLTVPAPPSIAIAEFTAVAGSGESAGTDVAGLAVELVTDLQLFEDIVPSYQKVDGTASAPSTASYLLTGIARRDGNSVQITASLKLAGSDKVVWSDTVAMPIAEMKGRVDDISQRFAEQLGSRQGPLHAAAMVWLDTHLELGGSETGYLCGLLFGRYRDSGALDDQRRAQDCLSGLLRREPDNAPAQAMDASLLLDNILATQTPVRIDPEPLRQVARQLDVARGAAPTDSVVWEQYARYLEMTGHRPEAEAAYSSALQLNPANLDAVAAFGRMLTLRGDATRGMALAAEAIDGAVEAPPWYFASSAISALSRNDYGTALSNAERLVAGDAELGSVIATVAARQLGSEQVLNRYFAQMLDVTRFRRFGILPVLRQRVPDGGLVDRFARDLAAAGVSADALTGPF